MSNLPPASIKADVLGVGVCQFSSQSYANFGQGNAGILHLNLDNSRVFLNLWFSKPMVCVRVAFHENDGNHENDENDEDNSDSYKQGVECWIRRNHGNHENDKNHGNPGCKPRVPQTTGLEIPEILSQYLNCETKPSLLSQF